MKETTKTQKPSTQGSTLELWVFSFLGAWILGKILLWPFLGFILGWFRPERTNNLSINSVAETLFNTRRSLIGVFITIAILLVANFKIKIQTIKETELKQMKVFVQAMQIMSSSYFCLFWAYQSLYWWSFSPITLHVLYANVFIYYNLIKAIGTILVLVFEPWRYVILKLVQSNTKYHVAPKQLFRMRIIVFGLLCLLYFWSSVPNENLGLPATLIFASFIPITLAQQLWFKYKWNLKEK
ncbi:MAG: hypothetical protein ACT6FF_08785 [Methanosarcinaceae archaeon]